MPATPEPSSARAALLAAARAELADRGYAELRLRAVARRAGVSHAAPAYCFGDRAGLLLALAAEGFRSLADALREAREAAPSQPLAALGRAYIEFGLAHPALFDLMFRPGELRTDDPDLQKAQADALGELTGALGRFPDAARSAHSVPGHEHAVSLLSWALVHGLVVLTRDGALQAAAQAEGAAGVAGASGADIARSLAETFSTIVTMSIPEGREERPGEAEPADQAELAGGAEPAGAAEPMP